MTASHLGAVALALVAAVLFGLAAVRQHEAVQTTTATGPDAGRLGVDAVWRLVRQPGWLLGAAQATVAGGSHILALALAPITLVQPIGVLAVPVTLLGGAVATGRRPRRRQVLGAVLGVGAVAALTVILLGPPARPVELPSWELLLGVTLAASTSGVLLVRGARPWPAQVRCLLLSVTAAVLFGLNAVLLRTAGHLVAAGALAGHVLLLLTALVGLALALPVGLWAMQSAYAAGSPQVVICCLTLVDPVTAVLGGALLLHDGLALPAAGVGAALACTAVAAAGVLLLARAPSAATSVED